MGDSSGDGCFAVGVHKSDFDILRGDELIYPKAPEVSQSLFEGSFSPCFFVDGRYGSCDELLGSHYHDIPSLSTSICTPIRYAVSSKPNRARVFWFCASSASGSLWSHDVSSSLTESPVLSYKSTSSSDISSLYC